MFGRTTVRNEFAERLRRTPLNTSPLFSKGLGENYLLPSNIHPSNEFDVSYDVVTVDKLLGQMQFLEKGMKRVIRDAFDNNPFATNFDN